MVNKNFLFSALLLLALLLIATLVDSASIKTCSQIHTNGDLDKDGIVEEYKLTNHVLTVNEGSQKIWSSPKNHHIDSFSLGDINNDGKVNLVISLWKEGSFGDLKPFWHTERDNDYKNHLFVYQLQKNTFKPLWCSSNLDHPILSFSIKDHNGDGLNELVVEEGQYKKISKKKYAPDPNGTRQSTIWVWSEWGFHLQKLLI